MILRVPRSAATVLLLVLPLVLPSCSGDRGGFGDAPAPAQTTPGGSPPPAEDDPSPRLVVVVTPGIRFDPPVVTLRRGEAVVLELRNTDDRPHTLTVNELSLQMRAEPGETVRLPVAAPDDPAELTMFCSIAGHRAAGHEGTLRVA